MSIIEKKPEIGCILASIILIENNIEISEKMIISVLDFAGIKFEKYWPSTFISLSKSFDLLELIGCKKTFQTTNSTNSEKLEKKETEKTIKETSVEIESDGGDMGFGLFD